MQQRLSCTGSGSQLSDAFRAVADQGNPVAGVQLVSPPRRMSRTKTLPADLRHLQQLGVGNLWKSSEILERGKSGRFFVKISFAMRPSFVPRPRPVSFPHRRNVIFFDWDDTLCPTSWIRKLLKDTVS